jgi:hypothetical protein
MRAEVDFLVDRADAEFLGMLRRSDGHLVLIDHDRTGIWLLDAGQYLDQCSFTCPVLAYQGVDLATLKGEINILKRLHTQKGLADAFHDHDFVT